MRVLLAYVVACLHSTTETLQGGTIYMKVFSDFRENGTPHYLHTTKAHLHPICVEKKPTTVQ